MIIENPHSGSKSRSFAPPTPDEPRYRDCAWSLIAFLAAVGLIYSHNLSGRAGFHYPWRETLHFLGVALVLLAIGVMNGVIALMKCRRRGKRLEAILGAVGIVINGLMIGAIVEGYIVGQNGSVKAQRRIQEGLARTGAQMTFSLNPTKEIGSGTKELERARESLKAAAAMSEGRQKLHYKAIAGYALKLQMAMAEFDNAAAGVTNDNALTPGKASNKSELEELRKSAERFLVSNERFASFLSRSEVVFSNELVAVKMDQAEVTREISSFRAAQSRFLPFVMTMRRLDEEMARSSLKLIELLENRWGEWEFSPQTGELLTDDKKLRAEYNGLTQQIEAGHLQQLITQSSAEKLIQRSQ